MPDLIYPVTKEDVPHWPWGLVVRFRSYGLGVDVARMQEINRDKQWKAGALWLIPFDSDPARGLGWYVYPFKEKPRVRLDDFTSAAGPLHDGANIEIVEEVPVLGGGTGRVVKTCAMWNTGNLSADRLWLHWANRRFRAWQSAHGGTMENLQTGDDCPPLILVYPQPVQAPAVDVSPSPPAPAAPAPDGPEPRNIATLPQKSVLDLVELAKRIGHLHDMLAWCFEKQRIAYQEAASFFASIRALSGLADLLSGYPKRGEPGGQHTYDTLIAPLKSATNDLYAQVRAKVNPIDPLANMAPSLADSLNDYANQLSVILHDPAAIKTVKAVADELTLDDATKRAVLESFGAVVALAQDEAVKAPRAAALFETMLDTAIQGIKDDDSVPAMLIASLALVASSAGNAPGSGGADSFGLAMVKVWGVLSVRHAVQSAAAAEQFERGLIRLFTKHLRLTSAETDSFREKIDRLVEAGTKEPVPVAAEVAAARREITEMIEGKLRGVHVGTGLNASMIILNLIQLYVLFRAVSDISNAKLADFASAGAAALQTASTVVAFVGNAPFSGTLKTRFKFFFDLNESLAGRVTASVAVLSIVAGVALDIEGWESGDAVKVTVGSLQVASGLALVAGVVFAWPLGQPLGVALGFLAAGIAAAQAISDALRPAPSKYFRGIFEALEKQKLSWTDRSILESLQLDAAVNAVKSALANIDAHNYGDADAFAPIYDPTGSKLLSLGFSIADRDALVQDDHPYRPAFQTG